MSENLTLPVEVARQVLVEAGHRCAVCGEACSPADAHIVHWRGSDHGTADELVCLCATCHERSERENWGVEALREYKRRPWIIRRLGLEHPQGPAVRIEHHPEISPSVALSFEFFTQNRATLQQEYAGKWVALVNRAVRFSANDLDGLQAQINTTCRNDTVLMDYIPRPGEEDDTR
jgi:hypothetical protein